MKNNTKKTLIFYLKAVLKYKVSGFFILLGVSLASAVSIIVPLYFKKFFDILSQSQAKALAVPGLIKILIIIAGLELFAWLCWRIATFCNLHLQTRVIRDLSNQCFQYLQKHSFSFFENSFVGSLVKKVKWFSRAFEVIADRVVWDLWPLVINISLITIVLFKRSQLLGLAIIAWTLLFLLINFFFIRWKLKYDIERAKKETATTGLLADTITNSANIKLFNGYKTETKRFDKVTDELRQITKKSWNFSAYFEAAQSLLMSALEIGVIYLAIRLWQKDILTIGDFVLIQAYLINMFQRLWHFGRIIRTIYENLADAEEMTAILNQPHEIIDIIKAKPLRINTGKIEFKNVDFYYSQTRKILSDFDLTIEPNEKVALIGPSGAGKTTVVKMLLRMRDLSAGNILIDGQDIAKITQESLRASISLVPQEPILFHRSLLENIRYGKETATEAEVMAAAKKANAHQFISQLSEGYQTFVGERGIKLSGGERQRVAIARAILRNSPILILDEATSSLDSASEKLIQEAIEKLMKNKTVLVIAHRLSTIRKMDRIIVIENGKIVEQGKHHELLANKKGLYKKLWALQAGHFLE